MHEFEFLRISVEAGVAEVVLDKPPVNSLSYEMYEELSLVADTLDADGDIRAVVFRSRTR